MNFVTAHWHSWAWSAGVLGGSIVVALLARIILFSLLKRLGKQAPSLLKDSVIFHSQRLARWILPLLAVVIALPAARIPEDVLKPLQHVTGLALIASCGWLAILVTEVAFDVLGSRYRTDVADNLLARKVHTQLRFMRRMVGIAVVIVTGSIMLMTFPEIHQIGTSLLASAGLAGLIVGVAMRPTLSSLIAGMQIALTQPIRIDDVVVVEGEWGWIEEIQTTHVVVRIWDLRRLVLPLSYFIEHPFQNWTHTSSDLLANVVLWVDYTVPVDELREEFTRILKSTILWKGAVNSVQVVDANDRAMQIRALMDAADSSVAWDLRCYVREKLIQFLRERYPQCLPHIRGEFVGAAGQPAPPAGRPFGLPSSPQTHSA